MFQKILNNEYLKNAAVFGQGTNWHIYSKHSIQKQLNEITKSVDVKRNFIFRPNVILKEDHPLNANVF